VPEDVRMTTRFRDDDFLGSLMGTVHETGHGRYEQNLPRDLAGPAGGRGALDGAAREPEPELRDAAGQPPGLRRRLAPLMAQAFGAQPAFEPRNLHRLMTRVKPGFIRVDADEVTYPAHIILRYEIERPLIEGEIEPEDVPALWDAKMRNCWAWTRAATSRTARCRTCTGPKPVRLLPLLFAGRDVRRAVVRRDAPRHARPGCRIGAGDLSPVFDWLRDNIWSQASRWTTDELARARQRRDAEPGALQGVHLEARYVR
jgi:carboxypeptidase Taq